MAQSVRRLSLAVCWLCLVASCTKSTATQPRSEPLMGGITVDSEVYDVAIVRGDVACSGFLLNGQWAMTAGHCISSVMAANPGAITVGVGGTRSSPSQTTTVAEAIRSPAGYDLALLRLMTPMTLGGNPYFQVHAYPVYADVLLGTQVACYGWGVTSAAAPPPDRPTVEMLTVARRTPPLLYLHPDGSDGGPIGRGDAGGFCVVPNLGPEQENLVLAVIVGQDGVGNGIGVDLTNLPIRAWIQANLTAQDSDVAASAASLPAAASPDGQEIDLFWVDAAGSMNQSRLQPDGPTVTLGRLSDDPFAPARPAAAYLGDQLHVFGTTVSGRILELVSSGGAPGAWTQIPSLPAVNSGVGLASWPPNQLDVFARTVDQQNIHAFWDGTSWNSLWDGTSWNSWEAIGGTSDTDLFATYDDSTSVHVFSTTGGHVFHKWLNGYWMPGQSTWLPGDITGTLNGSGSITTERMNALHMFGRGKNGHLVKKDYNLGWVDDFIDLGLAMPGDPTAVIAGARVHIFSRYPDGRLWHAHQPR
jgi:Trypsin